ncbi:hypothetical protein STEG23_008254 [Scotinomys teguina]
MLALLILMFGPCLFNKAMAFIQNRIAAILVQTMQVKYQSPASGPRRSFYYFDLGKPEAETGPSVVSEASETLTEKMETFTSIAQAHEQPSLGNQTKRLAMLEPEQLAHLDSPKDPLPSEVLVLSKVHCSQVSNRTDPLSLETIKAHPNREDHSRTKALSLEDLKAHPNREDHSRTKALSLEALKAHPNREDHSRTKALSPEALKAHPNREDHSRTNGLSLEALKAHPNREDHSRTKALSLEDLKAHPNREVHSRIDPLSLEALKAHPNREDRSRTKALSLAVLKAHPNREVDLRDLLKASILSN